MTNIVTGELIGRNVCVIKSENKTTVNIKGIIIDETKNEIIIKTTKGNKKIPKTNTTFVIDDIVVEGTTITKNPVERTKIT